VALSVPVDCEPLVARAPDQPPEAAQEVALVEDQVRVDELPLAMLVGLALKLTLGVGADTDTVRDCAAVPPAPVQVNVKLVAAVRSAVACEPLVAMLPLQPPDAAQEVALVEDQVRVEALPLLTVVGLALRVTDGAGVVTVTVAD
jgi:hypothetical protein